MPVDFIEKANSAHPSPRQLKWMETEYAGFLHFGMNTFSGKEEGSGFEDIDTFNPTAYNPEQWIKTAKHAGMQAVVMTAKHHEGFCLWQTETTMFSVKGCQWKNGEGDVVRDVAELCEKYGLKFGIYISPLDLNHPAYGKGEEYNAVFEKQLTELLTNYGDIYAVWIDGATSKDKPQGYNWESWFKLIRQLQPDCTITNCGPDVRWAGNNVGITRESEWSVVPEHYRIFDIDNGKINIGKTSPNFSLNDIGSRKQLKKHDSFTFYPAEYAVSLREGWFYRKGEDISVKPLSKLQRIYEGSVGANGSLLLGFCPQPDGRLNEKDIEALVTFGAVLSLHFEDNLALDSSMSGNCKLDDLHAPERALPDKKGFWHSGFNAKKPELIIDMGDDYDVDRVVLKEHIQTGQQIEEFVLFAQIGNKWKKIYKGTVIGRKRIAELKYTTRTRRVKLQITKMRDFATIDSFELY